MYRQGLQGTPGFFGGLGFGGQDTSQALRAGRYDKFGRPLSSGMSGKQVSNEQPGVPGLEEYPVVPERGKRGKYDRFGRPLEQDIAEERPKPSLLPAPTGSLSRIRPPPSRVTSAPVGPSKIEMMQDASRPIIKVDKMSSHFPWADDEEKKTSERSGGMLKPPPLPPFGLLGSGPSMKLDRPGLGFGEDDEQGSRRRRRLSPPSSSFSSRTRSKSPESSFGRYFDDKSRDFDRKRDDRRAEERKDLQDGFKRPLLDMRFEGRGLRDLYQDQDFGIKQDPDRGQGSDKGRNDRDSDKDSSDQWSRWREGEKKRAPNQVKKKKQDTSGKSPLAKNTDSGITTGSWKDSIERAKQKADRYKQLEKARNAEKSQRWSSQVKGLSDEFDSDWQAAETNLSPYDRDLFSSRNDQDSAWWRTCTICKIPFRFKKEFTSHVDEPLHYINLEKVRKEWAKEQAEALIHTLIEDANCVELYIYHCKVCGTTLNGWSSFNQHVSSQRHLVNFIKNVGPAGDPKSIDNFEVIERSTGKTNTSSRAPGNWRRCKSCDTGIPSWERYKIHLKSEEHLESLTAESLSEVIKEETAYIKKNVPNGKEKSAEEIEKTRKGFWEMKFNPNKKEDPKKEEEPKQIDEAYSAFLKEAGIDSDNRSGSQGKGPSNQQGRQTQQQQRGSFDTFKPSFNDYGSQDFNSGRKKEEKLDTYKKDGSELYDPMFATDDPTDILHRASAGSGSGPMSTQGQKVLSLFDRFLDEVGGNRRAETSQGESTSKLVDTVRKKLEKIGDIEDESTINSILDRVLNEYKTIKTGHNKPEPAAPSNLSAIQQQQQNLLQQQQLSLFQQQQQQQNLIQQQQQSLIQQQPQGLIQQQPQGLILQQPQNLLLQQQNPFLLKVPQQNLQQQQQQKYLPLQQNFQPQQQQNSNRQERKGRQDRSNQGQQKGMQMHSPQKPKGAAAVNPQKANKMQALLAASLAASFASSDKKASSGVSSSTSDKLMQVVQQLNKRLGPEVDSGSNNVKSQERKRPSRWSDVEDKGRSVSPVHKKPREMSPDRKDGNRRDGNQQMRVRQSRFDLMPGNMRALDQRDKGVNNGFGTNMNKPLMKDDPQGNKEVMMNRMGPTGMMMMGPMAGPMPMPPRGPGPAMPMKGGPGPKSLLPQPPDGPVMMGPGMQRPPDKVNMVPPGGKPVNSIEKVTSLYGDILNILAPASVNSPQEMTVATEMIAVLAEAMMCVLNGMYGPESQVKIQQSAQKFKMAFGNHPLVQAFFCATSVPPDVIKYLSRLDPMFLKRGVVVLQQARKDIQQQALQNAAFLENFLMSSKLR